MHIARQSATTTFRFLLLISLITVLVACSRENSLSEPDPFVEPEQPFCTDDSPFVFELWSSVDFTLIRGGFNTILDTFDPETVNNRFREVTFSAPFLTNEIEITPRFLEDYKRDELGQIILNDDNKPTIILLRKEFTPDMLAYLSDEARAELDLSVPEINSITFTLQYEQDGVLKTDAIDEDLTSVKPNVKVGTNSFIFNVRANAIVPRTGLECTENKDETSVSRVVNLTEEIKFILTRDSINDFTATAIPLPENEIDANDRLGSIVAVNNQFLALGIPNESSDGQGIFLNNSFANNTSAPSSGAVMLFDKDSDGNWQLHSVIKSSNSESGDKFGTAVSLSGNVLFVSAPGEDSQAAGVNLNSSASTDALKVNNTAPNSGAVYVYSFNAQENAWTETHYIKPEINQISDGDFDKGFGSKLASSAEFLLISAPNENSANGAAGDSRFPNSGAVYVYNLDDSAQGITLNTTLKAFNPGSGDLFGSSLALADNMIAVGAPFEDHNRRGPLSKLVDQDDLDTFDNNNRNNSGAVYVYSISNAKIIEANAYLKSSNSDAADFFGTALAISDDILFVGATGEDNSSVGFNRDLHNNDAENSGAVYVYNRNSSTDIWVETDYIKANDTQLNSNFGNFIRFNNNNLVISAPNYSQDALSKAGKVYLYEYKDGALEQNLDFQITGTASNEFLGNSIALFEQHLIIGSSGASDTTDTKTAAGRVLNYQ